LLGLLGQSRSFGGARFNLAKNLLMRSDLYHIGTRS
jgi:hypothetical protein